VNRDVSARRVTEAPGELHDTDGKSITNTITPNPQKHTPVIRQGTVPIRA
jgi:hypothetical protein